MVKNMNNNRRKILKEIVKNLNSLSKQIDSVLNSEEEALCNMPESLEGSERYCEMEDAIEFMIEAQENLDNAILNLETIYN